MERTSKPKQVRLSTKPTREDLAALSIGDIVHLDGLIYTAREGVYTRVVEGKHSLPLKLPEESAANFHCSPAATVEPDGTITMGAVTATASFRFTKWIGEWLRISGAKLIIGKGGMTFRTIRSISSPTARFI